MRLLLLYLVCIPALLSAQVISPFNKDTLKAVDSASYTFLVSGHFHGSSNNISGFPAASLLANIDLINAQGAAFFCTTGDIFLDVKNDVPIYTRAFFSKINMPLFNAPGNHDLRANAYEEHFGATWMSFTAGTELYIFLDTEYDDGNITGKQWEFLTGTLEAQTKQRTIRNIIVVSHRPIWSENDKVLDKVFLENTRSKSENNYNSKVKPLFKKYLTGRKLYWFSGSLGGNAPASYFYYVDKDGFTLMQTGIRDLPRDGMIRVNVNKGNLSFQTLSFTNLPAPKLEDCDLDIWKTRSSDHPFNYNLIPLYIKQMFFHRYFWYGIAFAFAAFFMLRFIFRKFRKRKHA